MGGHTNRGNLGKWQKVDEVTITPVGIDFLNEIRRIDTDKKRNYLVTDTTIVLTQIAIIGIALTIYDKIKSYVDFSKWNIPTLFSAVILFVIVAFVLLFIYKITNIIFCFLKFYIVY